MQFMRIQDVINQITIKKSDVWDRVKDNCFPEPIILSKRVTVWDHDDIILWQLFKKLMSKNKVVFQSREEEAAAWAKFQKDSKKDHDELKIIEEESSNTQKVAK